MLLMNFYNDPPDASQILEQINDFYSYLQKISDEWDDFDEVEVTENVETYTFEPLFVVGEKCS